MAAARDVRLVGPNCTGILSGECRVALQRHLQPDVSRDRDARACSASPAPSDSPCWRPQRPAASASVVSSRSATAPTSRATTCSTYWGEDPGTDLVLLYLESIPDPPGFVRIARRVSRRMPLVVVKAGRTEAGRRGAASHTAALAAGDLAVDALFHQAGVIRADSIEEMAGPRHGAELPTALFRAPGRHRDKRGRSRGARRRRLRGKRPRRAGAKRAHEAALRRLLAPEASVSNPVDMIAAATARQYGEAVRMLGASGEVDALVVMFNTPLITTAEDVADELVSARPDLGSDVALLAVFMNKSGPPKTLRVAGLPSFGFPENAVRALARSISWAERRLRPPGEVLRPEVDRDHVVNSVVAARSRAREGWLAPQDAESLLGAYGIALPRVVLVRSCEEAAAAQERLGCTTVVKIAAAIHKSDLGGVRLGVSSPGEAAEAVRAIRTELASAGMAATSMEFLVQEQICSGQEMIVGAQHDPVLGSIVMVGLGGRLVEVLGDIAVRVAPLSDVDVDEMLCSLKSYRLLTGFRGAPPLDLEALQARSPRRVRARRRRARNRGDGPQSGFRAREGRRGSRRSHPPRRLKPRRDSNRQPIACGPPMSSAALFQP